MFESGLYNPEASPLPNEWKPSKIFFNLSPADLTNHTLQREQGHLSNTGAICIKTGRFTGRSPKDRYIVDDEQTHDSVDWGKINQPIQSKHFEALEQKVLSYLSGKEVFVNDGYACADEHYRLNIRVIAEKPWSAHFANNMFLRYSEEELAHFQADWSIICAPGFEADPETDGVTNTNFAIINFGAQKILIGGTGYTGEIKKGIFSVLNYILPTKRNVLPMHCSANVAENGDTAIFFGLSGTGKTTLSTDPERFLIGDDEHGWSDEGVFNFEGGCYAKCIDLSEEKEPEIYQAIKPGAILENLIFQEDGKTPDYSRSDITQNTRVSYPIHHIEHALPKSSAGHPTNIFFLTADAFGVLPPISKLTPGQAMFHFISGYTAKVAGTEDGINEPQATFSACFGAPFMPLHPTQYAEMLGRKMKDHKVNIWLINTGWTGGPFGTGKRIKLNYTRAMIKAVLNGSLEDVAFKQHEIFGIEMPEQCPDVPTNVLNPKSTWQDQDAYDRKANYLAVAFGENFEQFKDKADVETLAALPKILA